MVTQPRYFKHYHHYLPILDPKMTLPQYFALSPFLAWAIVAIGSRRYEQDPTMLGQLANRVTMMGLHSWFTTHDYIQTIRGLLLICYWPFPMETIYKDSSILFSGIIMQLAVQHGLHMTGRRLDFVRGPLDDDQEDSFRASLWIQCKAVCEK